MKTFLRFDDIDRHGTSCGCGKCNELTGKSYGVGVFDADSPDEPLERIYAASAETALADAEAWCKSKGYEVTPEPEE